MTWPYSKHITSTDDQREISGTTETIRKDRKLQKLSRLRWEKPLREELGKLKLEKTISDKRYIFEKHYYETKLRDFKGKRILSGNKLARDNLKRKEKGFNQQETEAKDVNKHVSVKKMPLPTVSLPRRVLKWSLNDTTERKAIDPELFAFTKTRENHPGNFLNRHQFAND